jgi:hypothetical protein
LDLYRGQFDFTNFTTQVHDFDPGITPYPNGLFWTVPLQDGVAVNLDAGKARMTAANLHVMDFFNIPNALFRTQDPVSVDATVSFDIRWMGPATDPSAVTSPAGSSGQLFNSPVTMTWSAKNALGLRFRSNPSGTTSFFGQLGKVRNGIFQSKGQ